MKIEIKPDELAQIRSRRDAIQAAQSGILKRSKKLHECYNRKASLDAELSTLECASPDDPASIKQIGEKRIERELLCNQIAGLPVVEPQCVDKLTGLLRHLTVETRQALIPVRESVLAKIAKSIRQYCADDAKAIRVAMETDAARDVTRTLFPVFGQNILGSMPVIEADRAIAFCDAIIAGQIPVKFEAELQ